MNDDIVTTASCYLDGELTDAERRAAEVDPAVMAEVARMRRLQQAMNQISAPSSPNAIDERIAAAFADARGSDRARPARVDGGRATPAGDAPTTPTRSAGRRSTPHRSSTRWAPYLGVAAVGVGLALFGVVLIRSTPNDGATSSAADTASDETVAAASATTAALPPASEVDDRFEAMTDETVGETMSDESMTDDAMSESTMAASGGADSDAAADTMADIETTLVGVDELRGYTEALLTEVPAGALPLPAEDDIACTPVDEAGEPITVISSAIYEDPSTRVVTPVFVGVRLDAQSTPRTFVTFAVDRVDCSVIVFTDGTLAG